MNLKLLEANILNKPELDPLTYSAWGEGIDFDQWMYRERALCESDWARTCMRAWKFVNEKNEVVSTCETFRMQARGGTSIFGIASVVTPVKYRGKGYATQLLSQVIQKVESENQKVLGWMLQSEVGASIYERNGFQACVTDVWYLPPVHGRETSHPKLKHLTRQEALQAWKPRPLDLIQPTSAQIDWHFTREHVYREMQHPEDFTKKIYSGAQLGESQILWVVNRDRYLQVLSLQADSKADRESLLLAAQNYAAELNLSEVVIWNSECENLRPERGILKPMPDNIPMIRGIDPRDWKPCSRTTWC